ncbi:MAG: UDP-N-acetylmuramoyl-L-alanyl-D-glutamate--2,6-diaminopimelate ligase, partial [Prolixibacteraceae bacterium]|nr:UDP-N-acetylmuramoyl-L-alanyl-D-glutamate--2,6-diaminopimelate ligase [Prolixibacteraceae bacterium]
MGKRLKEILKGLDCDLLQGDKNIMVTGICSDSRKVKTGDIFVAVNGTQTDGHKYIPISLKNGASVIIAEKTGMDCGNATYIRMDETGSKLGIIASNFYGNPSSKLKIVGVTGTNGKTTIVTLLYSLFKELGYKVGLLSTIKDMVDDEIIPTEHTTPDTITIHYLMSKMVDKGCEYCFMEASSHA